MIDRRFRPHIKWEYPPNNKLIFEEWFYERYDSRDNKSGREYIPIFPTSYQVNSNYGRDKNKMRDLQRAFTTLDRRKKYFIICQYDDGIICDIEGLDVVICGMGGGRIDLPLPLICQPHKYYESSRKHIFASFQGAITHDVRAKMLLTLSDNPRYMVTSKKVDIKEYCRMMQSSTFALCPRGYGKTSFRICEALQWGAIPVYISDEFIMPFNENFEEYGIKIHADQIRDMDKILSNIPLCDVMAKRSKGKEAYNNMFTYEGCYQTLMKKLC